MITTVQGSVLENLPDYSVIVHQCNAKGWMGAGLAQKIAKKWPECFQLYHSHCKWFVDGHEHELMGTWVPYRVSDKLIICNAIAQATVGRHQQQTDYDAWHQLCRKLEQQTRTNNKRTGQNWTIHMPDKIGCGLGGGDYDTMHAIFEQYFGESPVALVFHQVAY